MIMIMLLRRRNSYIKICWIVVVVAARINVSLTCCGRRMNVYVSLFVSISFGLVVL